MAIRSLAVIAFRYPCNLHPTWHVFVRQIAHSFARQGVEVTVISPLSVHRGWLGRDPWRTVEDAGAGATVTVFRPRFLSLSSRPIGRWNTLRLTVAGIRRAVRHILLGHMARLPDALYGHFMYPAGAVAVSLGTELALPSFPAAGEISLDTIDPIGRGSAARELSRATAFVANSSHLARLMEQKLGVDRNRIGVFPNGINRRVFFPRDRSAMRQRYGLPADRFLVAYVGNFEPRKGARRVADAIRDLPGVGGVFVGAGVEPPEGDHVLFCRRVPHEQVPEVLGACDVFALPTTDEGCCNAIVEAMACGLPVVSSTGAFNDEILHPDVSIRVDPLDVSALRCAIGHLVRNQQVRESMRRAVLEWVVRFDIDRRAQDVLHFMEECRPAHRVQQESVARVPSFDRVSVL